MIAILVCLMAMLALHLATPFWWWIMLVPFLFGLTKGRSAGESLKVGAVSAGLLWGAAGLYYWMTAGSRVSNRVSAMMGVEANGAWLLIVTALVALLAAGSAALCGYYLKALWLTQRGATSNSER